MISGNQLIHLQIKGGFLQYMQHCNELNDISAKYNKHFN